MCEYDAPIVPADLMQHERLFYSRFVPFREFRFNGVVYYMNATTGIVFHPQLVQMNARVAREFNTYIQNNMGEFKRGTIDGFMHSMTHLSNSFNYMRHCNDPVIGMFCDPENLESTLRFKLFFAFGLLHNFLNSLHFKLIIRGGMALRMNLKLDPLIPSHGLTDKDSASNVDMDGLVIVDPSITMDQFEAFKTGFMKLLAMTISNSIQAPHGMICRPATGDANTIKLMIKQRSSEVELADISFKYANDNAVVGMYDRDLETRTNIEMYRIPFDLYGLDCKWTFPDLDALSHEYSYVAEGLEHEITAHEADPNASLTTSPPSNLKKMKITLKKFKTKKNIALGFPPNSSGGNKSSGNKSSGNNNKSSGNKKRNIRRKTRK